MEHWMKVVIYSSDRVDAERIRKVLGDMITDAQLEYCYTLDDLARWLRRPIYECSVAVLSAADKEELSNLVNLKDLFSFVKLILIAPDQDEETLTNAHKLRTRFLSFSKNDFSDVASVLAKMIGDCHRPVEAAKQI
jgi:hypothetical protein